MVVKVGKEEPGEVLQPGLCQSKENKAGVEYQIKSPF
jgi:hypothetical protein